MISSQVVLTADV